MFDELVYPVNHGHEDSLALPKDWWQRELADEFVISPVDVARERFREGIRHSLSRKTLTANGWITHSSNPDLLLLRALITLKNAKFDESHFSLFDHDTFSDMQLFVAPQALVGFEDLDIRIPGLHESPQLTFGLRGIFAPSKNLIDYWVRGVKALAHEATISSSGLELASTQLETQQEFSKMLISLFGTIGQQLRYGDGSDINITQAGRFLLPYQIKICDRFLIIPDEAAEFLKALRSEMVSALSPDSAIEGAWGRILVNSSGELYYALVPPKVIRDASFAPSEDIE